MDLKCKHCSSHEYRKAGFSKGKQRYKCRSCCKIFSPGDRREKYSMEQKIKIVKLYTQGVGLRTIERIEGISAPLMIHWIRTLGKIIKQHLANSEIPDHTKDIAILEVDRLFTLYKKNTEELAYGLLWTSTGIRLLIL
jgi:transposase-like protein